MVLSTSDAVGVPAKAHALHEGRLLAYLKQAIPQIPADSQHLDVQQFSHGQSNPTYLLKVDGKRYVLRKKPPGQVLASAHAVEREFQVLAALKETPVPVPTALCLCQDTSVIGTHFYVMEHVQGQIFIEPTLPELSPPERHAAYVQLATTLAALHTVRPQEVGLQKYGRPTGYCARQVWRWSQQYQAQLTGEALPEMMELIGWLKAHIPADDNDPSVGRISHGDYRIDNLIYSPDSTGKVLALLDWELSTLGYPLADLAYSAMCYHFPLSDKTGVRGLPRPLPEGIPSEQEYIEIYCQARGIAVPDPTTYAFCQALSMFRIAAILAGVGARAQLGNASSKHAAEVGSQAVISGIAQRALTVIREAAEATGSSQYSSSDAFAASSDGQDPSGNMAGGSASIYSQGPQKGGSGPAKGAAANTPAMPSMSGANAASVYADKFSNKPSGRQSGSKSLFETITGKSKPSLAASGISHNATAAEPKSDNMGGGSSAIYSQGPRKETGDGQDSSDSKKGANTPAMPSMSGANAASDYSESNKKKNLTGRGTQQGQSLYETITGKKDSGPKQESASGRSSTSASSSRDSSSEQQSSKGGRGPKETPEDPSSSMGGGSSSMFSQGPKGASDSKGSQGDASTPAMPSMSGTTTASSYSDKKQPLSGQGRSNSKIGHNPTSSNGRVETVSGIPTSSSEGTEDMRGRGPQGGGGAAGFDPPPRVQKLIAQVKRFIQEHMYAAEHVLEAHAKDPKTKWTIHPLMDELKAKARAEGLWNLWLPADMAAKIAHLRELVPESERHLLIGPGLSNLEYAFLSEQMGRVSHIGSEVFNCSAPDTGNMEVLSRYGSRAQQEKWLLPLLQGKIRSCFAMTEPQVASSDATNIQSSIRRDGDSYIVNGHKWWTSGAPDPRCKISIFMGKTDPSAATHKQQSMILVPMDAPGVEILRPLNVYGYDDAPHGHAEVMYKNVRVPASNMLLGEGRGFEIAQGRLGPGRLHHCMRAVGMGERAIELMGKRAMERVAFKKAVAQHGAFMSDYARCRIELTAARLTVLAAAHALDKYGNKKARNQIAAAKVYAPNVVLKVLDQAVQVHGGAGVCDDFPLASMWAGARTLRLADGPDDVHLASIAKFELAQMSKL